VIKLLFVDHVFKSFFIVSGLSIFPAISTAELVRVEVGLNYIIRFFGRPFQIMGYKTPITPSARGFRTAFRWNYKIYQPNPNPNPNPYIFNPGTQPHVVHISHVVR
jgi:hypothetical protein